MKRLIAGQQVGDLLCGFILPNDVTISSGSHTGVTISFTSDQSVTYQGFAVSVMFYATLSVSTTTIPGLIL